MPPIIAMLKQIKGIKELAEVGHFIELSIWHLSFSAGVIS